MTYGPATGTEAGIETGTEAGTDRQPVDLLGATRIMRAWRSYFETAERVRSLLDQRLKETTGSDLVDFNILLSLAEAPEKTLTLSDLADRLVFSVPRLSYRISVLVDRDLVTKSRCPQDGRAHNVALTRAGLQRYQELGSAHRRHIRDVFDDALTTTDMDELERIMTRMAGRLSPNRVPTARCPPETGTRPPHRLIGS